MHAEEVKYAVFNVRERNHRNPVLAKLLNAIWRLYKKRLQVIASPQRPQRRHWHRRKLFPIHNDNLF